MPQSLAAVVDAGLAARLSSTRCPGWCWSPSRGLAEWSGLPGAYAALVAVFALAADAAFTVLLLSKQPVRPVAPRSRWLLAVPLLGATTYARFDLVPGILAGVGSPCSPAGPASPRRRRRWPRR